MLEVRFDTETKELTAWCADEEQFGNLDREGNTVAILDIPIPDKPLRAWLFDEANQTLIDNPDYISEIQVSYSSHLGQILAIDVTKVKPLKARVLHEKENVTKDYDCFVTKSIKDQYLAGTVSIGDYVIIHFFELNPLRAVCTDIIFKSW